MGQIWASEGLLTNPEALFSGKLPENVFYSLLLPILLQFIEKA
jgi:hypothetical protein